MNKRKTLNKIRIKRTVRVRAKIFGVATKPRFAVSRSNRSLYVQLIDDDKGHTLVHASSREIKEKKAKTAVATMVGELFGKRALEKGIAGAVFDRRGYKYHGRVKAVVEGARKAGLKL